VNERPKRDEEWSYNKECPNTKLMDQLREEDKSMTEISPLALDSSALQSLA
jgi:hypothetical protein